MKKLDTLRKIAGLNDNRINWESAVLLYIDFQNEYTTGKLSLGENGDFAINKAERLLKISRNKSIPIFHILHKASEASSVFNCESEMSCVIPSLSPKDSEIIVNKSLPNSFFNTELEELLKLTGRTQVIISGFMSHMCVTATTIKAGELGYEVIVCEDACATRSLSGKNGIELDGKIVHQVSMAALADRYATVLELSDFT